MPTTRPPAVAGQFYPADPEELSTMIDGFLNDVNDATLAEVDPAKLKALIVPHAGYPYSGPVAAAAYKLLMKLGTDVEYQIILLGVSHHLPIDRAYGDGFDVWQTPLGEVELTPQTTCPKKPEAHEYEHSLEVQVPFLQKTLKNFKILPLVSNRTEPHALADKLKPLLTDNTILIVSSDLSHYLSDEQAHAIDQNTCQYIIKRDSVKLSSLPDSACGLNGILTLLTLAQDQNWQPHLLKYAHSGDVTGDQSQVVGYASFGFTM